MSRPSDGGLTYPDRVPDRVKADLTNANRVHANGPGAGPDLHFEQQPGRSRLLLYLLVAPMVGVGPSLWVVLRKQGDRPIQSVARQSLLLAMIWLASYGALEWGAMHPDWPTLPLLLASSACTSAYLLCGVWLMAAVWRRRSLRLGPISTLSATLNPPDQRHRPSPEDR